MQSFLHERPLLLLFGVAALGYLLGQVRVLGVSLGLAAVLFAGLFVGWLVPGAGLPEFVLQFGLVLFVYTIGIASGPGFFASLRLLGLRDNALALGVLCACFALALALGLALGIPGPHLAGVFAGALNNTPALAAVTESLQAAGATSAQLAAPVLAYSICYPLGALFPLLAVALSERIFGDSFQHEPVPRTYGGGDAPITNATLRIAQDHSETAQELRHAGYPVLFSRMRRGGVTAIVHDETRFKRDDLVTVIGTPEAIAAATLALGERASEHLELELSEIGYRRMFVSSAEVTERPLHTLQLARRYEAVITRVRRGDVDITPDDDFELMLGDRARVVAPRARIPELERLLGDSARRVAEIDVITFGLGITLGLLLGAVSVPLPGGASLSLGLAGGPLVVGLVLGRLGRTGPLVWAPPYGANLTLRQLGAVMFLAGVGLRAGGTLRVSPGLGDVLSMLVAGAAVTALGVCAAMYIGHRLLRIPLAVMVGTLAGIQTQPAVLAYAIERTQKDTPNIGYASVFPVAMIAKILLAQALLQLLGRP